MSWLLPLNLPSIDLPDGVLLAPWHYGATELRALLEILRRSVSTARHHVMLPWEITAREVPLAAMGSKRDTLALLDLGEEEPSDTELDARVAALACRHVVLRWPTPRAQGYGWLERRVKPAVVEGVTAWMTDPEHPLAGLRVASLPVRVAAGFTSDPVELLTLLEGALAHRLQYAHLGWSAEDYVRSLWVAAGKHLGAQLMALDAEARAAAVDVLLRGAEVRRDPVRFQLGAKSLERIGRARFLNASLALDGLSRNASEPLIRSALPAAQPEKASAPAVTEPALGVREGEAYEAMLRLVAEETSRVAAGDESVREGVAILGELVRADPAEHVPLALSQRVVAWLRDVREVLSRGDDPPFQVDASGRMHRFRGARSGLRALVAELVRVWAARGEDRIELQAAALGEVESVATHVPEWGEKMRGVVRCVERKVVEDRVSFMRSREDLVGAFEVCMWEVVVLPPAYLKLVRVGGKDASRREIAGWIGGWAAWWATAIARLLGIMVHQVKNWMAVRELARSLVSQHFTGARQAALMSAERWDGDLLRILVDEITPDCELLDPDAFAVLRKVATAMPRTPDEELSVDSDVAGDIVPLLELQARAVELLESLAPEPSGPYGVRDLVTDEVHVRWVQPQSVDVRLVRLGIIPAEGAIRVDESTGCAVAELGLAVLGATMFVILGESARRRGALDEAMRWFVEALRLEQRGESDGSERYYWRAGLAVRVWDALAAIARSRGEIHEAERCDIERARVRAKPFFDD